MRIVAIGGSDAGVSAALRVRELDDDAQVTVVLADSYPNFSICGIPCYVSGDGRPRRCETLRVGRMRIAGRCRDPCPC